MNEPQTVIVKKQGCGSGCAGFFGFLVIAGLTIQYWYIVLPVGLVVALALGWFLVWGKRGSNT